MNFTRRTLFRTLAASAFAPQIGSFAADPQKKSMIQRSDHPLDLEMPFDGFDSWMRGGLALEQGFIFSSMILAAATAAVVDRRFRAASLWCALGAAFCSFSIAACH